MMKKILLGIAVIAGLVSCNDDYTDWAAPQTNGATETTAAFTMTAAPTAASADIDFAQVTAGKVQLFTTNLSENQTDGYTVTFSAEGEKATVQMELGADASASVEDLQKVVSTIYGKAGKERTFNVSVKADVRIQTADGEVVAAKEAQPFTMKMKLVGPYISEHYYIVGAPSSWTIDDTSLPFTRTGDGVFEVTFPVAQGDTWFAISDDVTLASGGDWSSLLGCAEGNGNNGMEGGIARRSEIGNDGSWKIVADHACYAKVTIDMNDYKYKIELLDNVK